MQGCVLTEIESLRDKRKAGSVTMQFSLLTVFTPIAHSSMPIIIMQNAELVYSLVIFLVQVVDYIKLHCSLLLHLSKVRFKMANNVLYEMFPVHFPL